MANNKKALFWTSYSDLMTSMFAIMLVLFAVAIVALNTKSQEAQQYKNTNEELADVIDSLAKEGKSLGDYIDSLKLSLADANATKQQLDQILQLQDQFKTLTLSTSLEYDVEKRMFYAKDFVGKEIFEPDKDVIKSEYIGDVDRVGQDIKQLINSLKGNKSEFRYLLVIEGTAAIPYEELRSKRFNPDNKEMYKLSYRRALALYDRWKQLNFRDSNTEIIIAGSGFNGINRDGVNEDNNKRFVIQIIPKIGKPNTD